ncbi:MAG: iron-containing alcohol dehydrogenase [Thermoplasmatales archaeon]|nr:iron-containing alcohol dehydrogenase [Candidatus Thermoplasmatota archaeon]MCL6002217.1 iron-containing alcohol dehydrogenase [Candidatus Thermoplasmatota archaeon]MDA8055472.1 iron-containing alcohol dehydrogenase [Thermoplasmatales archaeon]
MTQVYNYLPIDQISVGEKSIEGISSLIGKEWLKDTVLLTSNSVSQSSFFKRATEVFADSLVFHNISQHSPVEEIDSVVNEIRDKSVKFILSIGGGSVMDSAKVVRSKINPEIPQIAVPTTLSAAEFSHIAGYSENGEKKGIRGKKLVPRYIFLDPNATLETPTTLWRSTGIRSIDHAIEATLGEGFLELRKSFSKLSVEKMMGNLEGNWTDMRQECQIASWYSYIDVYDSPMGYSHQIGKLMGVKWNIPHGMTSCITLPAMLRYYSSSPPKGLAKLAISITGENDETKSIKALADKIGSFIKELGLERKLSDYGIKQEDLSYIAAKVGQQDEAFIECLNEIL